MEFTLEVSPAARRDLKRLPENVQNEILFTHLPAIKADPYGVGRYLRGTLKGESSYHFGRKPEYRIIYFIKGELITVTILGTRENIYKRAKRRRR
jgi:mRNA-degrading endonuclease RelE of RelBE toxin-antitoxin system